MENIISEKTLIPVSVLATVIGGVFWLSNIYATGESNASDINLLREEQRVVLQRQRDLRLEIKEDLIRVEAKIDKLLERQR